MTEAPDPTDGPDGRAPARHRPGTPCWVSLMVRDLDVIQAFYGELFGWEFEPGPRRLGPYVRAVLNGREVAGIGRLNPDRGLPVTWTPYLASDDVDLTAESVRSCGGTVGVGPLDADPAGRLLIGSDPGGAVFGVWQASAHRGTALAGMPGTPAWNELRTFETAHVAKFYGSLFDYEARRREPGTGPESGAPSDYVTLSLDGRPVAGVLGLGRDLPRDRGPHWVTYFEVADTDASLARISTLGGHTLALPHNTDFGRVAMAADPEGARFGLLRRTR